MKKLKVDVERNSEIHVALSIEPDGDYNAVCDKLSELEEKRFLEFETCEAQNSNNFDVADE